MIDSSGVGGRFFISGFFGRILIFFFIVRGEGGIVCIVCVGEYLGGGVIGVGGISGGILSGVEDFLRILMILFCIIGFCLVFGIVFCLLIDIIWGFWSWIGGREFCLVRELVLVGVFGVDICCFLF